MKHLKSSDRKGMESLLYRLIEENDVSWVPLGTSLQKQRDDEDRGINAQHDSEKVNSWLESEVDRLRAENERLKKEVENAQSNALVVATPAVNGTPSMQRCGRWVKIETEIPTSS